MRITESEENDSGEKLMLDSATLSGILERKSKDGGSFKETIDVDKRFLRIYLATKT